MNSDMLLNRIRMAQQGLIGVHKKLYTLEHLLPSPDPAQFAETAKSAADDDAPIAYRPVKTTKTAARAKIDVAVDDDE